jgi:hypothetical protein
MSAAATMPPSAAERQGLRRFETRMRKLGEPRARLERLHLVATGQEHATEASGLPQLPGWMFVGLLTFWGVVATVAFRGCQ